VVVLAVIFPKANGANIETAALIERAVETARALVRSFFLPLVDILELHFSKIALLPNVCNGS
jgi:hypothetical protein